MNFSDKGVKLPDNMPPAQDRAAGALMGVLIGDAMAVGPHWYYDLDEMRQAYRGRITDYVPVLPNRYHIGVALGDVSQSGQFNNGLIWRSKSLAVGPRAYRESINAKSTIEGVKWKA